MPTPVMLSARGMLTSETEATHVLLSMGEKVSFGLQKLA